MKQINGITALGIESTAHTLGIGILRGKSVLANVKDTYTTEKGGIIPNDAALHHEKVKSSLLRDALDTAGISVEDVDVISFSRAPGLAPCLIKGMEFAKGLSRRHGIPIVGVNHCIAHLSVGSLFTPAKDPVLLYVSGANTQVIAFEGDKYRVFGETLDMGVGNFLDSFARHMGMGFPGGPKLYKLSLKARKFVELPYVVKGMNISVSGILTNLKQKYDSGKFSKDDLAYSAQETVFSMLLEVAERAMAHCGKDELLLGGGVCCNTRLQKMAVKMCEGRNAKCFIPPNSVLMDNGVMIAWQGILQYAERGGEDIRTIDIEPAERTDYVEVFWK